MANGAKKDRFPHQSTPVLMKVLPLKPKMAIFIFSAADPEERVTQTFIWPDRFPEYIRRRSTWVLTNNLPGPYLSTKYSGLSSIYKKINT
jgi:hypothetical protein